MAYVIGSQKGKDIAKNMKTGETYKCSDGSTWTKQSDGSVSVKTSSGQTFKNAYKPTSSGGGSSKTIGGTVVTGGTVANPSGKIVYSSGSSSNKSSGGGSYSPYSVGGIVYNPNEDYMDLMTQAYKNGNPTLAAYYEQLRNYKIDNTGNGYDKTNNYQGYLDKTDYGQLGQQLMNSGADWKDVYNAYQKRYDKASNTVGMEQYTDDEIMQQMLEYIQRGMNSPEQQYEDYLKENPLPEEYNSKYDPQIDALLSQILNRDDFSYNVMNDPLYQQYSKMYAREGDRAMKETMAEAAAGAGGMNSFAITAAQQAANNYSARLNDTIPQLYQLAYEMYLDDKESQIQNLGILQNADATQYSRYRDTMNDYKTDRNFWYGVMQDDLAQNNLLMNFDYNKAVNDRDYAWNDLWTNKQWDYNTGRDEINDSRYDKETAKEEAQYYINMGVMPDDALLQKAGMDKATVQAMVNAIKAEMTKTGTKSSGGSSSSASSSKSGNTNTSTTSNKSTSTVLKNGGKTGDITTYTTNEPTTSSGPNTSNLLGLDGSGTLFDKLNQQPMTNINSSNRIYVDGYGFLTYKELKNLITNGRVIEKRNANGTYTYTAK